ncbi:hypothetical protein D3C83_197250 [compost metagenome]
MSRGIRIDHAGQRGRRDAIGQLDLQPAPAIEKDVLVAQVDDAAAIDERNPV